MRLLSDDAVTRGPAARTHRRANRVSEDYAGAVAIIAGAVATLSPAQPTGRPVIDAVLVGSSVGIVVFAGASAPWWAVVIAAAASMAVGVMPVLIAMGAVALGLGLWLGMRRRSLPLARALSVGISMNVLAWSELGMGPFGLTAALALAVALFVFIVGIRRRPRKIRRVVWWALGGFVAAAAFAFGGFGYAAASARSDLEAGQRQAESGITALEAGDFEVAAQHFSAAGASFRDARDGLGSPLAAGASVIPVLAQHRAIALDLASAGSDAMSNIGASVALIDPSALKVNAGSIDVAAIAALGTPFADIDTAMQDLSTMLNATHSPWIVQPILDKLATLSDRIADSAPQIAQARRAVALTPDMLGASGARTYLVLFTTPSEARGLGGFIGNYAELTIDQGTFTMSAFGRVSDLEARAVEAGARVSGPSGFLESYGDYGYNKDGNGLVGVAAFRNLTMTPNFPWVGEVATSLYAQTTGVTVDGVIAMDPFMIAALLGYTDGVQLDTMEQFLTADNAADFILRDQYIDAEDNGERVDALEEAARKTMDALLTGSLPDPTTVADDFGTLGEERRLMMWTADDNERDLVREIGLLGEIPTPAGANGWSVAVTNGGGSKIDAFLERRANYEWTTDPATGVTTARLRVDLLNNAPSSGLPNYVIGNAFDLPDGTSRLLVSFYSSLALESITLNGVPIDVDPSFEAGWNVYTALVDTPSGATSSFDVTMSGHLERPDELVTWTQPLATPLMPLN